MTESLAAASPCSAPGARRPVRRRRSRERGVALVLVLGALTILTVMLTDFQDSTSAELGSALSARDSLKAEYAARSAINLSRLLIASEPTIRKALAPIFMLMGQSAPQIPVWEFSDQVLGAFNDKSGIAKFAALANVQMDKSKNLGLEGASYDVDIIDEDSKINLNSASRELVSQIRTAQSIMGLIRPLQYDPMFQGRDADGQYTDRLQLCAAIIDWVDSDVNQASCDFANPVAAAPAPEDTFYQLLDPPYLRKNAPFDSLEELHMVRGVSDDFWATFVDPDPDQPKKRNLTVWGQGKINVNSANAGTILAIICGYPTNPPAKVCSDPLEAAKFLGLVTLVRNFGAGIPLFGSPKAFISTLKQTNPMLGPLMQAMGISPIVFQSESQTLNGITTESKVFSIIATGSVKSGNRETRVRIHAVVDFRNAPPPPQVLALAAANGLLNPNGAQSGTTPPAPTATTTMPGQPMMVNGQPFTPPQGATSDAYAALLVPSPGGRVIYYRVE